MSDETRELLYENSQLRDQRDALQSEIASLKKAMSDVSFAAEKSCEEVVLLKPIVEAAVAYVAARGHRATARAEGVVLEDVVIAYNNVVAAREKASN